MKINLSRLAIDPGHGMGNRRAGQYDPGATAGGVEEADIALAWALTLKWVFEREGIPVWLTRDDDRDPAPVGARDDRAELANCSHFLSIHANAAASLRASGTETFYRDAKDKVWAGVVQAAAMDAVEGKDRGLKAENAGQHARLAVFDFDGPCALLELEFITNAGGRVKMLSRARRVAFAKGLVAIIGGKT